MVLITLSNFQVLINKLQLDTKPNMGIYLSLSGPAWLRAYFPLHWQRRMSDTESELDSSVTIIKTSCAARRRGRLILNRLSSVFTADYIIEVGEITPLFMLPSRRCKWETYNLPAVYLIMQSVQDAHHLRQPASDMFQQLTAHCWRLTSDTW